MTRCIPERKPGRWSICAVIGTIMAMSATLSDAAYGDESGVSYWLPGRISSLAATPQVPGWSMAEVYYHTSVSAFGAAAASREIQIGRFPAAVNVSLNLHLNAQADLVLLNPTYTFATPVLGGQLAVGVTGLFGRSSADLNGTLTTGFGPIAVTRTGSIGDSITSVGDLYPQVTLKWNQGVHNFMAYATGDIPVGAYDPNRLANLGIGHGAIDGGGGYTYFNPQAGHEFSAVAGFTYNFKNPDTQYQSGVDFHVDWGASQFLSKQLFVGLVGYAYQQITDDFGSPHPRRFPLTRRWRRPADRISVSGRRHAGLSQSERLRRIRRGKPAGRLEYMADVLDLTDGAHQHGDANTADRDEIAAAPAKPRAPLQHIIGSSPWSQTPSG